MSDNLKLLSLIVLVCLLAPVSIKQHNAWEDGEVVHQGTAAWHPHRQYSPDVEAGLSILASVDTAEVTYFRSRGYPVSFITGISGKTGDTTRFGVIEIPRRFEGQPAQLAVVLSHEIVHEQRHDPFVTPTEYPLWRRLLWHEEEEVAHNKDLWVALKLWPRYHSVWNVLGAEWIFEPFFYLLVGPLCVLDVICLLLLASGPLGSVLKWLTPRFTRKLIA